MPSIQASSASAAGPYFPRDAAVRRVHREGVLLLGGGRALLMQIAHPDVARGVAEHSSYSHDRISRLLRTLRSTLAIVYGTRQQAMDAVSRVNLLHRGVNGEGYRAMDPDLLLWVLATIIDTAVVMHEGFLGPIDADEAERYYGEMCEIGSLLGIPAEAMHRGLDALRRYVDSMSRSLVVSDGARTIARDLFAPLPYAGPAMLLLRQLTAGMLHPALREGFGLDWGSAREAQLRLTQRLSRAVLPRAPLALRRTPAWLLPRGASLT